MEGADAPGAVPLPVGAALTGAALRSSVSAGAF